MDYNSNAKVCMITTDHSAFDDRLFYKESRSLLKNGYYVYIVTAAKKYEKDKINKYTNLKIEHVKTKTKSRVLNWILRLSKLFIKSLHTHADIYHCHEPDTFLIAILLKIFTKKKIIYDVYECYQDVVPLSKGLSKYFLIVMLYLFEPLFCRFADGIITADSEIAKRYKNFNENICVLYNFPCLDIFKSQINQTDVEEKSRGQNVIIYVGGMSEERGVLELIKAVHKVSKTCSSVKLLLVGWFGTKDFEEKCAEYIKSNNLERNIEFIGSVPHTKIPDYIFSADIGAVLLQPIQKFYKNIPTKQFEYMACGKPVIGSNLPPISRYVGDACGILVDPTNIDEIANAMIYLVEHPEEAKRMGKNGKKAILERYNWTKEEKKLLDFYKKIFGR